MDKTGKKKEKVKVTFYNITRKSENHRDSSFPTDCLVLISLFPWVINMFSYRFDIFGIYVVMFLEILKTLLQVLSVFSILLIAFGMAFFMLMNKEVITS